MSGNQRIYIALVGDKGVGKTSLVTSFLTGQFNPAAKTTIGMELYRKPIDQPATTLYISDRAGDERFQTPACSEYQSQAVVMVVFDLMNQKSFSKAQRWVNFIRARSPNKPMVLVGTKFDLVSAQNSQLQSQALAFAKDLNLSYIETSAKTLVNVHEAFTEATQLVLNFSQKTEQDPLDGKRAQVRTLLQAYIDRINSHTKAGMTDFGYGFWFFKTSRAWNRWSNFTLAEALLIILNKNQTLQQGLGLAHKRLITLGKTFKIGQREDAQPTSAYCLRTIRSKELNAAIFKALELGLLGY